MEYQQAIEYILNRLRHELPKNLVYHAIDHTADVVEKAKRIAIAEGISEHELTILLTAAAFHDSGFLFVYNLHEEEGCKIANEFLPQFGFTQDEINQIKEMIMATKIPQSPKSELSKILCDADLDYLGGQHYYPIANGLYQELHNNGKSLSSEQWLAMQINFLKAHRYWTNYAQINLEGQKQERLQELELQAKG